ncbi:MAG: biphenyl 2,3-dioxygenase [Gloeomargaritaceae cyanobacterium C42_A2020_066]|nr:biphenyl 2,3-dioxygenase [Gloeomargaritaceae cyanobacterium C42_A2020_066]
MGRSWLLGIMTILVALGISGRPALAVDFLQQPPQEIHISLGTSDNQLRFVPDSLSFTAGQRYKLILDNPSPQKHYFTDKDFADAIWTQKVEAGRAEIKGAIHDLELKPAGEAVWLFVPLKPGTYPLRCTIPGHTEAGMVGSLRVTA